jgi:hypothetical protein
METPLMDELRQRVRTALTIPREGVVDELVFWEQVRRLADGATSDLAQRVSHERIYTDGEYASAAICLTKRLNIAAGESSRIVQRASGLDRLPAAAEGLGTAKISVRHADAMINAHTPRTYESMKINEASFVEIAANLPFADWNRKLKNWRADCGQRDDRSPRDMPSSVKLFDGAYGRGVLHADLCPSDYLEVKSLLRPAEDRIYRRDVNERETAKAARRETRAHEADGPVVENHGVVAADAAEVGEEPVATLPPAWERAGDDERVRSSRQRSRGTHRDGGATKNARRARSRVRGPRLWRSGEMVRVASREVVEIRRPNRHRQPAVDLPRASLADPQPRIVGDDVS